MATSSPLGSSTRLFFLASIISALLTMVTSDFASDQAECADQLASLAGCLTYVQGNAKRPTPDCCTSLKQVLAKSPKCLCVLIKDRDDPELDLHINVTLAVSLPSVCGAHANISECTRLLNLPPNSKDAQMFKQLANATEAQPTTSSAHSGKGNSTSSSAHSESAHASSSGQSNYLRWLGVVDMLLLFLVPLMLMVSHECR